MCALEYLNRRGYQGLALNKMSYVRRLWRWWIAKKNTPVRFQYALIVGLLLVLIAFFAGRLYPESDYRQLRQKNQNLDNDVRQLSDRRQEDERQISRLELSQEISNTTVRHLQKKIKTLSADNLQYREDLIFYQRALGTGSDSSLKIYALESAPDFSEDTRQLFAVLLFSKKEFSGDYFFELAFDDNDKEIIKREPATENFPLNFNLYHEIEHSIKLPADVVIKKMRLVVRDENGKIAAEAETTADNEIPN